MTSDHSKQNPRRTAGKDGGPGRPSIRLSDLMPRNDVKGGARWIFGVGERQAAVDSGKGDIASRTNTDPNQRTG